MDVSENQEFKPTHTIATELVTPELAKSLLNIAENAGFKNRNCSERRVAYLCHVIESGQWADSNDCVCVDTEGVLINGYHRMNAIIKTDSPVWMTIKRGMERATFQSMDTGKKRTASDVLTIEGVSNSALVARALKLLYMYEEHGNLFFGRKGNGEIDLVTNAHVLHLLSENPEIVECTKFIKGLNQVNRLMPPGFLAFAHYLLKICKQHDPVAVDDFFLKLNSDGLSEKNETPFLLRKKLLEDKLCSGGTQLTLRAKYSLFIKCWNYYIIGTKLSMLRFSRDDSFPDFK